MVAQEVKRRRDMETDRAHDAFWEIIEGQEGDIRQVRIDLAQEQQVNAANTATIGALKNGVLLLVAEEHRQAQYRVSRAGYSKQYGQVYVDALAGITKRLGGLEDEPPECAGPAPEGGSRADEPLFGYSDGSQGYCVHCGAMPDEHGCPEVK